jgi:pyruvate kinase
LPTEAHLAEFRYRRTKIIATLGPSSDTAETIQKLIEAGVNVFRLNFSHGDHESHARTFAIVREVALELGEPVGVLADLCGPKIRTGAFEGGHIELPDGGTVTITTREVTGKAGLIPCQYKSLAEDVAVGSRIMLDDGNLELAVESVEGSEISARVVAGGTLKDHKGMNLPGVAVSAPSLTEKDREDAAFALDLGVDFLALSFVRSAADIAPLREILAAHANRARVISKIEKPEALDDLDAIIAASDGVMIARGDLGVELPPQVVPQAQEQIIKQARHFKRPVIVATQMLESMIQNPRPTRAEVSDVAGAVRSGADAVMLSGESAAGLHPVAAVVMMDEIARRTEAFMADHDSFGSLWRPPVSEPPIPVENAIARATADLSRNLAVRGIVIASAAEWSSVVMSAARPAAVVFSTFADPAASRRANILWGVVPVPVEQRDFENRPELARRIIRAFDPGHDGESILLVRGFRVTGAASTPSVTVLRI